MDTTEIPDTEAVLAPYWPLHGPYNDDRSRAAASLLSETVRYLNYATGQGARTALPYASSAGAVVNGFQSVAGLMDQTLRQLIERIEQFEGDPMLYDYGVYDNHAAAVARAELAQEELAAALGHARMLYTALSSAYSHLNHLGHKDA